jgi:hypothetical protein
VKPKNPNQRLSLIPTLWSLVYLLAVAGGRGAGGLRRLPTGVRREQQRRGGGGGGQTTVRFVGHVFYNNQSATVEDIDLGDCVEITATTGSMAVRVTIVTP